MGRDPNRNRLLGYNPKNFAAGMARMLGLPQHHEPVPVAASASGGSDEYPQDDDPSDTVSTVERLNTCGGKSRKPKYTNHSRRRALAARRSRF